MVCVLAAEPRGVAPRPAVRASRSQQPQRAANSKQQAAANSKQQAASSKQASSSCKQLQTSAAAGALWAPQRRKEPRSSSRAARAPRKGVELNGLGLGLVRGRSRAPLGKRGRLM
eukprot:scaffold1915_cov288-Prasinococcus_capsulatus_cf.AAC.8